MTTFDVDQQANAALIVAEVKRLGLGVRAAEIAVDTADTESGLRNLPGGDRDSAGLFQQRPSQGWGTVAQVTDPAHATDSFLGRLAQVPGWSTIAPWLAAQRVQISAFADGSNYQANWPAAQQLADQLYGVGGGQVAGGAVAGAVPASSTSSSTTATPASFLGGTASAIVQPLVSFGMKATFLVGGVVLVVAGAAMAAAPKVRRAAQTAETVAPLAAL